MSAQEPQWLDEEEQEAWLALASVFLTLPGSLDSQLQADSNMSFYEYMVLAMLSHAPDETLRLRNLAALTNGSLSRVSQVATRLEVRGWLKRRQDPEDGRTTLATLTAAGRRKLAKAAPGHVATVRRLVLDPLTKTQVRQLRDINRRIRGAIEPGGRAIFGGHGS
ncbi:MarR family transcriptional regulator [Phycicoccus sp. CSK15P-2]|uniref:MarR family winged helix-turn-helix transcriptional regulator n=1 Tax=Phycicoccus sp. CSK15P-2 TaxID=2807627 RepID=UPI0027DBA8AD|nr:MarR family transcriptional regulator [Phycicoccus sp. CSK15P-2]